MFWRNSRRTLTWHRSRERDSSLNFSHNNFNEENKLLFLHNPKAAGTSIRRALGMVGKTTHLLPSNWVPVEIWNEATILLCVRHPLTRFISSYDYHVRGAYKGGFLKVFPDLKRLSPDEYFLCIKRRKQMLPLQTDYLHHAESTKVPDIVTRVEDQIISQELEKFGIMINMPRKNVSPVSTKTKLSNHLTGAILNHYAADLEEFNYGTKHPNF